MESKCNWRPLICLGLRALMKPLLPGVVPCCSHSDASPPVMLRAKPVGPAVPEKLPGAFFRHGKMTGVKGTGLAELWRGVCSP